MQALYSQISVMLEKMDQRQKEMNKMIEKVSEDSRLSTCDDISQMLTSWKDIHTRLRNIDSMMSECIDIEDVRKEKNNLVNTINMLKAQLSESRRQYNDSLKNSKKSSNNNSLMIDSNNILDGMKQDDTISLTINDHDRKKKEIEQLQKEVDRLQKENDRLSHELVHQAEVEEGSLHANSPPANFEPKSMDVYEKQTRNSRDNVDDSANIFKPSNQTIDQHQSLLALAQYISGGSKTSNGPEPDKNKEDGQELPRFFQPRVRGSINPNLTKKKDLKIETEIEVPLREEMNKQTPDSINLPPTPPRSVKIAPPRDARSKSDEDLKVEFMVDLRRNSHMDRLVDMIKEKDENVVEIRSMLQTIEEKIDLLRTDNNTLNSMIQQQDEDQERIKSDILAAQQEMSGLHELIKDLHAVLRADESDELHFRSDDQVKIQSTGKKLADSSPHASDFDINSLDSDQLRDLLKRLKQEKLSIIEKFKKLIEVSNLEKSHMKEKLESILAITNRFNQQLSNL